ncbi:Bifunctional solanapyrone synthase [Escovopsis weberi]|uniref:Bifunctional solanapyrone synthase n=1 Tax=Escovopsis weberi TaxID=150374 RepID=A0A0M9VRL3_ESCWE|nr:Bifunctional solanapyrone synthase [Escovopsis weberi]
MRLPALGLHIPLLLQLAISGVQCLNQTFTLDQVQAQITNYTQSLQKRSQTSVPSGCHLACDFLSFTLPQKVSFPKSSAYELQQAHYWSQQQALSRPECRIAPGSAIDVSFAILTFRATQCRFSVKSGGHAAFAGASNTAGGVTMDLVNLDQVSVSRDKSQVSVGAGNTWYRVFSELTPQGLTVVGGRVSAIGVGGLVTGGGMSFISSQHGWACDNVNTFEVVLGDGTIKEVSYQSQYSDLYFALRGGGNNFGIVTRFDLKAYPQGDFWAGSNTIMYTEESSAAMTDAFYHFGINAPSDPLAQTIIAYAWVQEMDTWVIVADLQYAKPVANPPILQNFTAIPSVSSTLRQVDLPSLTVEFNNSNPGGYRQTFWTLTVQNDATLMSDIIDIYMQQVATVADANGLVPSISFQAITTDMTTHFAVNGGNALGLANQGPLNLINVVLSWMDAADDTRIMAAAKAAIDHSNAAAKARKLDHPFLYMNYASYMQDVFPGYGAKNVARLKSIRDKYDPHQVFTVLQPGYFKLPK